METVTLEQLERRVIDLEREVAELRGEICSLRPYASVEETFGLFANDPDFDEIVRLGWEYREQINTAAVEQRLPSSDEGAA